MLEALGYVQWRWSKIKLIFILNLVPANSAMCHPGLVHYILLTCMEIFKVTWSPCLNVLLCCSLFFFCSPCSFLTAIFCLLYWSSCGEAFYFTLMQHWFRSLFKPCHSISDLSCSCTINRFHSLLNISPWKFSIFSYFDSVILLTYFPNWQNLTQWEHGSIW